MPDNPDLAPISSSDRQAVLDAESTLLTAVLSKRREAAEAVLSPQFVAVGHAGNVVGRGPYLDIHFSPERDFTVFETWDQQVGGLADGAALVVGLTRAVNALATATVVPDKAYTAVFVRSEDGGWHVASWQETPLSQDDF